MIQNLRPEVDVNIKKKIDPPLFDVEKVKSLISESHNAPLDSFRIITRNSKDVNPFWISLDKLW